MVSVDDFVLRWNLNGEAGEPSGLVNKNLKHNSNHNHNCHVNEGFYSLF